MKADERLLSRHHVAEQLGVSLATLDRLTSPRGSIEPVRIGRRVLFEPAAIAAFLRATRMPGYCALCRAKEIEVYGTVLSVADDRHDRACEDAGCRHPAYYTFS